ncbi:MAG: class I SAM-dependent methyltransferase [Pseudomonadota bacterium]|nr:class I SAM-dependent methyltransferase [Pseudomonadota bacterium]
MSSGRQARPRWISNEQAAAIRQIDHFCNSEYQRLDLDELVDEYMQNFVAPLIALAGAPRSVADIGAGYGWLAFAFALGTDAEVTMMEYDPKRSQAAQQIAAVLGIAHRIRWLVGSIAAIPLNDREIDAVYCVEVIEHTGVEDAYVAELCRISNDVLVITTPNKVFPIIKHDTVLPFCHWLPLRARDIYAGWFGRRNLQQNNLFWSPRRLLGAVSGFERQSRFLQFENYSAYRSVQQSLPRRSGRFDQIQGAYFAAAARTGRLCIFLLPNLASTFRRKA